MSELPSAEENIQLLLTHFQQQGQNERIRDWRQQIENKEARATRRAPRTIAVEQAVKDFRHALLRETEHSESAKHLLRELNRPAQPKFTAVEAWRLHNPSNRPASLTPEQQAYLERYDKREQERRKWCVEISTDRWNRLGALEEVIWNCRKRAEEATAQGYSEDAKHFTKDAKAALNELRTNLAKIGEQWYAENPELVHQLVDQFTGKSWVRYIPTKVCKEYRTKQLADLKVAMMQPLGASPVFPQEAFYKGRLYYIAANLILKYLGLEVEVARSVMGDLQEKLQALGYINQLVSRLGTFDPSIESYDAAKLRSCDVAAGSVYWDLYEQLQKDGIGCIPTLESYLSDALSKYLDDPDQVNDRSTISFSTLQSDSREAGKENRDTDYNLDRILWNQSADYRELVDPKPNQCDEGQKNATERDISVRETILAVLKTQLTPRQQSILFLKEQGHTHQSIAEHLALDPKTIQREFRKIKDFAQTLRAQHRL